MKIAYFNGKIFTSDEENEFVSAFLVEKGKILKVGGDDEICKLADESIDLESRTIIPGIVDAHMHPLMLADYSTQIACLPPNINSIKELKEVIAKEASCKKSGEWILGWGFDEGKYAEGRMPKIHDIDEAAPNNPVFLVRSCEHIRLVNSKAFEIAGVTKNTKAPKGGQLGRDENGELNGLLMESARDLIIPYLPKKTDEDRVIALLKLGNLLASQGIVAACDMGNLHAGGNYGLFRKAENRGLKQSINLYYMWDYFQDDTEFSIETEMKKIDSALENTAKSNIKIAGIKLIGDGSISGKTAWLKEPYLDTENFGLPVYTDESMEKAISFAKKNRCQISVHAMGGRAIDRAIDRLGKEGNWIPDKKEPHVRLEHITEPSKDAMLRAKEHEFAVACQPIFAYCEVETYLKNLGIDRLKTLYPFKDILDIGVKMCISTDAPATSWAKPSDPFVNIKAAVTKTAHNGTDLGQKQKLDIKTAIELYTREAAQIGGFEKIGMIKEGYDASFLILSDDIFNVMSKDVDKIRPIATYIKGNCVYKNTIDTK